MTTALERFKHDRQRVPLAFRGAFPRLSTGVAPAARAANDTEIGEAFGYGFRDGLKHGFDQGVVRSEPMHAQQYREEGFKHGFGIAMNPEYNVMVIENGNSMNAHTGRTLNELLDELDNDPYADFKFDVEMQPNQAKLDQLAEEYEDDADGYEAAEAQYLADLESKRVAKTEKARDLAYHGRSFAVSHDGKHTLIRNDKMREQLAYEGDKASRKSQGVTTLKGMDVRAGDKPFGTRRTFNEMLDAMIPQNAPDRPTIDKHTAKSNMHGAYRRYRKK